MKRSPQTRAGFTLIELLVVIGIITVLLAIFLPALSAARERAVRLKCAANLRSLGQVMRLYAHDNKGQYPRTRYAPHSGYKYFTPKFSGMGEPFDPRGNAFAPDHNDVTAAYFLLIYYGMLRAETFICPATDQKPDPVLKAHSGDRRANFAWTDPLGQHLSYSLANPYPFGAALPGYQQYKYSPSAPADLALAADRNDGEPYRSLSADAAALDLQAMNSSNHKRKGQNVLFNDGSVSWSTTPFCGHARDNVYTAALATYGRHHSPHHRHDSLLLPIYPMRNEGGD